MICSSLEEVRSNIDRIDTEIIKLIAERTEYVRQASSFKESQNETNALNRVDDIFQKVSEKAIEYGADPDMILSLYTEMISCFINMEKEEFRENQD